MPISGHASGMASQSRTRASWIPLLLSLTVFVGLAKEAAAQGGPKPKPGPQPKKEAPKVDDIKINPEELPPNFEPPKRPLAMMSLEMPIATPEEMAKLKRELSKFTKVKTDCDLSESGRKVIQASIRYRLANLTTVKPSDMRDKPNLLMQMRQDLLRELAINAPAKRPADIAAMAEVLNKEVLKQIPELLKNNFYVRLSAVLILSEMDYKLAYVPGAYELLLQVITAKDAREDEVDGQPEAIKIDAVKGLIRILRFGNCPVRDRTIIANIIVQELNKKQGHWWRQERMIEVLRYSGVSGVDAGNNNHPFLVECLLGIVRDDKRDWRVRAKACYCLGRVQLPAAIKPEAICVTIADFALQMANAAAAKPEETMWKGTFWDLYLAFHAYHPPHSKELDQDGEGKRDGGLLNSAKAAAQPVYELIHPIVSDVLNGKAPDAGNIKRLGDYVRARPELVQKSPKTNDAN